MTKFGVFLLIVLYIIPSIALDAMESSEETLRAEVAERIDTSNARVARLMEERQAQIDSVEMNTGIETADEVIEGLGQVWINVAESIDEQVNGYTPRPEVYSPEILVGMYGPRSAGRWPRVGGHIECIMRDWYPLKSDCYEDLHLTSEEAEYLFRALPNWPGDDGSEKYDPPSNRHLLMAVLADDEQVQRHFVELATQAPSAEPWPEEWIGTPTGALITYATMIQLEQQEDATIIIKEAVRDVYSAWIRSLGKDVLSFDQTFTKDKFRHAADTFSLTVAARRFADVVMPDAEGTDSLNGFQAYDMVVSIIAFRCNYDDEQGFCSSISEGNALAEVAAEHIAIRKSPLAPQR